MNKPTAAQIEERLTALSMVYWTKPFDLTIFGIRSPERKADGWDDLIGIMFSDDEGRRHCLSWEATTDPGTHWLEKLGRPDGTAIMVADRQYRGMWERGLHRNTYRALVQCGPTALVRDANKDDMLDIEALVDAGRVIEGADSIVGINLHRSREFDVAANVGPWSAGCQVIRNPWDYAALMKITELQVHAGHGSRYSYALLDEWR